MNNIYWYHYVILCSGNHLWALSIKAITINRVVLCCLILGNKTLRNLWLLLSLMNLWLHLVLMILLLQLALMILLFQLSLMILWLQLTLKPLLIFNQILILWSTYSIYYLYLKLCSVQAFSIQDDVPQDLSYTLLLNLLVIGCLNLVVFINQRLGGLI